MGLGENSEISWVPTNDIKDPLSRHYKEFTAGKVVDISSGSHSGDYYEFTTMNHSRNNSIDGATLSR